MPPPIAAMGVHLLAEPAALHDRDRLQEQQVVLAALLRADLKHAARFLHDVANAEAFLDRERERLFAIHVAAGCSAAIAIGTCQ